MNPDYVKCTWKCFRSTHQQNKLIYSSTFVLLPRQGLLMNTQLLLLHVESFFYSPTLHWVNERDNIGAKLFLHFMKAPPSSGQYSSWYPIRCTHHVIAITLVISGFAILQLTQANSRNSLLVVLGNPLDSSLSHMCERGAVIVFCGLLNSL